MLSGFSIDRLAVLAALVFFAGVVDALAGGGGLITLPAYLSAGLDPALVLGTNKLASSIGTLAASVNYQLKQKHPLRALAPSLTSALIGAFLGARLASGVDPRWIKPMLLVALPVVGWLVYSEHHFGKADRSAELGASELARRSAILAFPLGCYDGFIGPGTGTFFALALSHYCRYDLLGSTTRAKHLNLATNAAALAAFLLAGRVHVALGLAMAAVSVLGNYLGSHLGLRKGAEAIRPAVLLVCAGLFAKLLLDLASGR